MDEERDHEKLKLKLFKFPVSDNIYISFSFTLHMLKDMLLHTVIKCFKSF